MESSDSKSASVRAAPRRARKDPNEAPVFLQKTYQMIDTAPTEVASWSAEGDTFIVKDMEAFANLLPRFFKHKNFRSFVRQLNFYGFRKLRTDGALISDRPAHWWEFRHEKFLRGKPELLTQIKRANHYEATPSDQIELVEDLKGEVSQLKERIEDMNMTIDKLTSLVDLLMKEREHVKAEPDVVTSPGAGAESVLPKKRRIQRGNSLQRADSLDMMRAFENEDSVAMDEASLFATLSIDSQAVGTLPSDLERSFSAFDFDETEAVPGTSVATDGPLPLAAPVKTEASVGIPPVAPYLATAAIGAFFTKLASEKGSTAQEGMPLVRAHSLTPNGITVQA